MPNNQPIQKRIVSDGSLLYVHSIFHTIQGEGPFCGMPAVFIRLEGCNLCCPGCDTDYTSRKRALRPREIYDTVALLAKYTTKLVVITGGEPFRQQLHQLTRLLCDRGYIVQIETNGTLAPTVDKEDISRRINSSDLYGYVYIVCSPKTGKVNQRIQASCCCYKYVGGHDDLSETDGLPLTALGHSANPILFRPEPLWDKMVYLQPRDDHDDALNASNIDAVKASCLKYGYTLQLQIHKYIGVE